MSWQETTRGPAATAARDQTNEELFDIIRDARVLFLVATPSREDGPEAIVRGVCALPPEMDDFDRAEIITTFLVTARRELDEMIETLGAGT